MRAKAALVAAAVLGVGLGAQATAEPMTAYERVLADIVAAFGFVPPTAEVGGVEVPTEDALALLRANDGPLASGEGIVAPTHDGHVGVRRGPSPCSLAIVVTAVQVGNVWLDPMDEDESLAVPTGRIACGPGYPYATGSISARPRPGASMVVCVPSGGLPLPLAPQHACHDGDFDAVGVAGHVGHLEIRFSFFGLYLTIEQLFAGVAWQGNLPDAAVLTLGDAVP